MRIEVQRHVQTRTSDEWFLLLIGYGTVKVLTREQAHQLLNALKSAVVSENLTIERKSTNHVSTAS